MLRDRLSFSCLNIRSLNDKLDNLLEVRRDMAIDLMCLVETWHDVDSINFSRLRMDGYQVVDRPRPRAADDLSLSTNHGGVAIVGSPGIQLSPFNITVSPTTFEFTAARLVQGSFAAVIVVIYRPGSHAVQASFFAEFATILDCVATHQERVFLVGDVNIRCDRPDEPVPRQLFDLVTSYGFGVHTSDTTHKLGGAIDVVITQLEFVSAGQVCVTDVGLSDHHLVSWSVPTVRVTSSAEQVTRRPWRKLDVEALCQEIVTSLLCQHDLWPTDTDALAELYDTQMNSILDKLIPSRQIIRRQRSSDAWFDAECRDAKRLTRRLEHAYAAAIRRSSQRRSYYALLQRKRRAYWVGVVEANRNSPKRLWGAVDHLLGRGRLPVNSAVTADDLSCFFEQKVAAVQASTVGAPAPVFTSPAHSSTQLSCFKSISTDDVVVAVRRLIRFQSIC